MSIKSFLQYRAPLFVEKSEHILEVTHGNDGELYALCYHPKDTFCFVVRYTTRKRHSCSVRFHSTLHEAQTDIKDRIARNAAIYGKCDRVDLVTAY